MSTSAWDVPPLSQLTRLCGEQTQWVWGQKDEILRIDLTNVLSSRRPQIEEDLLEAHRRYMENAKILAEAVRREVDDWVGVAKGAETRTALCAARRFRKALEPLQNSTTLDFLNLRMGGAGRVSESLRSVGDLCGALEALSQERTPDRRRLARDPHHKLGAFVAAVLVHHGVPLTRSRDGLFASVLQTMIGDTSPQDPFDLVQRSLAEYERLRSGVEKRSQPPPVD